ncbi:hypothetical protein ASD50_18225 [Mesorhizobium sp. Root552]|nr:hypothetical protein ASD50_18225 [Mesorhizobium sp. Root552]
MRNSLVVQSGNDLIYISEMVPHRQVNIVAAGNTLLRRKVKNRPKTANIRLQAELSLVSPSLRGGNVGTIWRNAEPAQTAKAEWWFATDSN